MTPVAVQRRITTTLVLSLLAAAPAVGTEVRIFQTQTQAGFLAGTLEGLSVDPLGRLELAHRAERLTALGEPFLLSAAPLPREQGWVVGTGNAGRVFRVGAKGEVSELFAAAEPEIFAVWADPDGTVFAGASPGGKVYRIPPGAPAAPARAAEVWFDSGETYVWSLARAADGALLVGTGTQGKVFRVTGKGRGEVLHDSDDTHARTLEPLPGGGVLVGTAGEGLILRVEPGPRAAEVRALHDAAQPEVVALATTPDGTIYAALVASEASLLDAARPAAAQAPAAGGGETVTVTGSAEAQGQAAVVVSEGEAAALVAGTRKQDDKGPRSEVVRIAPSGLVESVWTFADETVYDLLWHAGRLWVATGLEGKLFSFDGSQMLLEKDVDERQVVALVAGGPGEPGPAFATTNAAAFYRFTSAAEKTGAYTSAALDAGQVARFGSFRWRGEAPRGSAVRFAFRSGVSSEPDRTWSAWTDDREGQEVPLAGVPPGRFVQWRASFSAEGGATPRLYGVELSYRQENLTPKIESLSALEPGQILVPSNFNPGNQVYEPAHPNRDGIFQTLEESGFPDDLRLKPLWKKGFRSLRWRAADPNGDRLLYELSFQPLGADGTAAESRWLAVAKDLAEDHYSFDATVLPDGVYRFRLVATDRPSNDAAEARSAERLSEPVVVDHALPVLGRVEKGNSMTVTVSDALSPLREAVWSADAGEWKPAEPTDGLLDGRTETLHLDVPGGASLVLLRVTDAAYNVVTFDLSRRVR